MHSFLAARQYRRYGVVFGMGILKFLWSFIWLPGWFSAAQREFSDETNDGESFSKVQASVMVVLFVIAYGFYGQEQIQNLGDVLRNFVESLSLTVLADNVLFVIAAFTLCAFLIGVPPRKFLPRLLCVLHPLVVLSISLPIVVYIFQAELWGDPFFKILGVILYFAMVSSFIGFVYTMYRAAKTRLGAHSLNPVLVPIIELALSVRAVSIALRGEALLLWFPHIPSRLVAMSLTLAAVIFYTFQAVNKHRDQLKSTGKNPGVELRHFWKNINDTSRSRLERLQSIQSFRRLPSVALIACLTALACSILIPPQFMQVPLFQYAEVQYKASRNDPHSPIYREKTKE